MQSGWGRKPGRRCYKQGSAGLTIAGAVLIALGLLLLFLCIPGWAWAALAGLVFIGAGYLLLRLGRAGR